MALFVPREGEVGEEEEVVEVVGGLVVEVAEVVVV